jgi:ribonuclease HI
MGVIEGLKALTRPCEVVVLSDSAYVVNAHLKGWIENWKRNGWKTASKKPVENQDLWKELLQASAQHTVRWELVKGHSGHELNDRADALAVAARERLSAAASS